MKPYYQDQWVTLYCADSREFIPDGVFDAWITDPIWPDNKVYECDPLVLCSEVFKNATGSTSRIVVQLGCDSDPRFLTAVPEAFRMLRVCWLRYACPSYKGRVLYSGDVAYVFGKPPSARKGAMVLPGEVTSSVADKLFITGNSRNKEFSRSKAGLKHPSPRRLQHVLWLVRWFGESSIFDPFAGSGTTLIAAKQVGIRAVGIEINPQYCNLAARRLEAMKFVTGS